MSNPLSCQECHGEGHIEVGDASGEPTGWEDCDRCDGTGIKPCIVCGAEAEMLDGGDGEPVCRRCEMILRKREAA